MKIQETIQQPKKLDFLFKVITGEKSGLVYTGEQEEGNPQFIGTDKQFNNYFKKI